MNALYLVVDGLHAGYLGCYGNTWLPTPALDVLASEAFLFDQCLIESPDLKRFYRSLWWGEHACVEQQLLASGDALPARLSTAGVQMAMITDDAEVATLASESGIQQRQVLEIGPVSAPAETLEQTALARFFASACEAIRELSDPFTLWMHTRALCATWDAPLELRNEFVDEQEEGLPPQSAEVPRMRLDSDFDPDDLLGIRRAYAGQIVLLDHCIGGLIEMLHELEIRDQTLLWIISPRGFPLGEHALVGSPETGPLHEETIHVPAMLRLPDGVGAAARSQELVQPADLYATHLDWAGLESPPAFGRWGKSLGELVQGGQQRLRDRACIVSSEGQAALRTPAWMMGCSRRKESLEPVSWQRDDLDGAPRLYVKPDDRWEVNNVASLCEDLIEELSDVLEDFLRRGRSDDVRTEGSEPPEQSRWDNLLELSDEALNPQV